MSNNMLDTNHSDLNSLDTSSLNSFSLSVSVCVSDGLNTLGEKPISCPVDVPPTESIESSLAYSDSGYSGTDPWSMSCSSYCPYSSVRSSIASVYSDHEVSRKLSTDSSVPDLAATNNGRSEGNLQRRILRNLSTSFENRKSFCESTGFLNDAGAPCAGNNGGSEGRINNRIRLLTSNDLVGESKSNPEMFRRRGTDSVSSHGGGNGYKTAQKRAKLGMAICITVSESVEEEMQIFCAEHIILLESMLCRLRATAENAYINHKKFYQIMLQAWFSTTEYLMDLFTAPRLNEPIWLALSSGHAQNPSNLANCFMTELCWLLNCADTKDTNL